MPTSEPVRQVGYLELLRDNRPFRLLWVGQFISQTGDWFHSVALFILLLSLTGSVESVAFVLILKLLPTFFVGPLAGVIVDRANRKTIMIVADVVRGLLVLGFLLIQKPDQVWIAYVLTATQVVMSTFFEPAKTASIPNIVKASELVPANGLATITWSATLSLGAAAGGFVANAFGRDAAFMIDSASFFLSAVFIALARIERRPRDRPQSSEPLGRKAALANLTGLRDMVEGARYLKANRAVAALLLVKAGWGIGGGVLLLLAVFGKQIFPIGRDGATSIGILYAARGIGALLGPIVAQMLAGPSARAMRLAIAVAFFVSAAFYLTFAQAPNIAIASLCVMGAHAGGSVQWVFSTTLLQMTVPDQFRGRVFALELALVTLTMSLSTYLTGLGLDRIGGEPRMIAGSLGLAFALPGFIWWALQRTWSRVEARSAGTYVAENRQRREASPASDSFPPP